MPPMLLSRRRLLTISVAAALMPRRAHATAPRLAMTTGMLQPWTMADKTGFTDQVIAEAGRRMGLDIALSVNLAASRAIQLADDGVDDGLAARVNALATKYPNLVQVSEPIFENDFVACSLGAVLDKADWNALVPHSVGYIIGWQVFQNSLPQVNELTLAKDTEQLFTLLERGRIRFLLHERWQALWHARERGITLTVHEPPLARVPMFVYLHRRHAELAPRFAATLAAMKADGAYARITASAFAGLDPRRP